MPQRYSDNASSVLAANFLAASTSMQVATGAGNLFPVAGAGSPGGADWFKVVLANLSGAYEIVYVHTRAAGSSVFSGCLRGQEGSVARDWVAGDFVRLAATAKDLENALLAFPSGTRMLFQQSAAPPGWTKETLHNDAALRVVSGSVSSGGSVAFSAAFTNKTITGTVGGTTLTIAQMPSHGHSLFQTAATGSNLVFTEASLALNVGTSIQATKTWNDRLADPGGEVQAANTGGGQSHTHAFTGASLDFRIKYVDFIIATKD